MEDESGSNPKSDGAQPSVSPSPHTSPASPPFRLLIAEDNLADILIVRDAIKAHDLSVIVEIVADGEQAIRYIADAEADPAKRCPDCVLLDLNLPKRNGFEILQRLRNSPACSQVPVVIMTSSNADIDRSRAAAFGASFFRKPSDYDEFLKLGSVLKQILK